MTRHQLYWSGILSMAAATSLLATTESDVGALAIEKLNQALDSHAKTINMIAEARSQKAHELNKLETEFYELRKKTEAAKQQQDAVQAKLEVLHNKQEQGLKSLEGAHRVIQQYQFQFEATLPPSELDLHRDALESVRASRVKAYQPIAPINSAVLEASFPRLRAKFGGHRFEGEAVSEQGDVLKGSFLLLGPIEVFSAGTIASSGGIFEKEHLVPHFKSIPGFDASHFQQLVAGETAPLAMDFSGGDAIQSFENRDSLWKHIQKGGIWIWPILAGAGIALVLAILKAFQLYRIRMPEQGNIHEILRLIAEGERKTALKCAELLPHPTGGILIDAIHHAGEDPELVEEVIYENILSHQPELEKGLSTISLTAATAPLMGLLGTVTGMIHTFQLLQLHGTQDPKILSTGISEALITTEFGLVVAIPALILYGLLTRKAHSILSHLEKVSVIFVNGLRSPGTRFRSEKGGSQ